VTTGAALFALAALLATLAVDTLDRRRDVRRIERLGATSSQVRAGAALHAATLFGVLAVTSVIIVTALVGAGTHAFNDVQPGIPVPFRVPYLLLAAIVIAIPAIAAAFAAVIARPRSVS
jgi:4-hydroxybenzoate polyprenyltransferase